MEESFFFSCLSLSCFFFFRDGKTRQAMFEISKWVWVIRCIEVVVDFIIREKKQSCFFFKGRLGNDVIIGLLSLYLDLMM